MSVLQQLRQQQRKPKGQYNKSLADFIAPKTSGLADYVGAFAVTAGLQLEERAKAFEEQGDDYNSIMLKALGDRLAEAAAEYLHEQVRKVHWAYVPEEDFDNNQLIKESYVGIRPAPGYPACPDHMTKIDLFALMNVSQSIGIDLTESLAMWPASSVCGMYFSHPKSQYFSLGMINEEQVRSYAERKKMSYDDVYKWLKVSMVS